MIVAKIGASFAGYINAATGIKTLATPAANAKGLALRTFMQGIASSAALYADTVAPAAGLDATKRALFIMDGGGLAFFWAGNLLIPAGYGLYLDINAASNRFAITWDLLS